MSLNHQITLNVFVVVFVFLLVETGLLILLINCQIGHMCPMTLMTLKDDSLSDIVTNSATLDRLYLYNRPSWIIFRSKEEDLTEIEKSGCLYQVSSHVLLNNDLEKKTWTLMF